MNLFLVDGPDLLFERRRIAERTFLKISDNLTMATQQNFSSLELPKRFPRMQHLALHSAFSESCTSIKSIDEMDSCPALNCEADSPVLGENICDEALNFIRNWELKMQSSSDSVGVPRYIVVESLEAVDYSKPPRRFWRTSWKCMTKRLAELNRR